MSLNNYNKTVAISAILSAILYGLSIIGLQVYISADLHDMDAFASNIVDNKQLMLMYGWPGIIATMFILPLVYQLTVKNESNRHLARVVAVITGFGLFLVILAYLIHLALVYFHAPIYLSSAEELQPALATMIETTIGVQDMMWIGGDVMAFGGIAALLVLRIKANNVVWVNVLGIASGILAAFGSFSFIPEYKSIGWLGLMFMGGFVLFALWEILTGIILLLRSGTANS